MKYILFNPNYVLKPDNGKTLMMVSLVGRKLVSGIDDSFTCVIHPIYAMILSFIDGRDVSDCVRDAAQYIGVSPELVQNYISTLIDNPEYVYLKGKDGVSVFPPFTIVSKSNMTLMNRYNPDMFDYDKVDLRMTRHLTPSSLTIMINNICVTNCIYCYQDKSRKVDCTIPFKRIIELIHEAFDLHVNSFDVIGGEFFLYKHWKEVLAELRHYGYNPYLSTKMPLKEDDIKFLSDIRIRDIQVSIDSLIEEHLIESIAIKKGYVSQIIQTLKKLDQYGIRIMVHTVLTRFNDSVKDMDSIFQVLKEIKHLQEWHVVKGVETLYPKTEYKSIEISDSAMDDIIDFLEHQAKKTGINIISPKKSGPKVSVSVSASHKMKVHHDNKDSFFNRVFCSGLFSSLYILPDGKVTICEQLYWNKDFIIGDVTKNSIQEIWDSDKAKSLYYIKQEDIPSDSLCHSCEDFEKCRRPRQVCYREIIKKYGTEKWYYPDVKCPYVYR